MLRKFLAAIAAMLVLTFTTGAAADPVVFEPGAPLNLRIRTESTLTTDGGSVLRLPAEVHILGPAEHLALDDELRRAQDAETRLQAENDSLRKSARSAGPGWGTVAVFFMGFVGGIALRHYAFD